MLRGAALKPPLSAAEAAAPKCRVMVDGAGGYVASRIVERLLAAGYTVHAAVRSRAKAAFLEGLPGAEQRLVVFEGCDLLAPGSFDAAMQGCECVMHTASPFRLGVRQEDVKRLLVDPAVEGTKTVLDAVSRTPSVRRVVMTSSIAAVLSYPVEGRTYTEDDWNTEASEARFGYELSKTLAEQAAWEMARAQGRWSLVTLNPGLVMGPPLSPQHAGAESVHMMRRVLRGDMAPGYPEYFLRMVDVRDLARAHLAAMKPEAHGRYLLTPHVMTFGGVARALREGALRSSLAARLRLPSHAMPRAVLWLVAPIFNVERYRLTTHYGVRLEADGLRAEAELLGKAWIPEADTYNEMALAMYAMGGGVVRWRWGRIDAGEAAEALLARAGAAGSGGGGAPG